MRIPLILSLVALLAAVVQLATSATSGCPSGARGRTVQQHIKQASRASTTPYIFNGQRADYPCQGDAEICANPLPQYWRAFCSYETGWEKVWTDYMICPKDKQAAVLEYYAQSKVPEFDGLLSFSPCDLWPLIRGKTLWVVGDSHSFDFFHAAACFLLPLWDDSFKGALPIAGEAEAFKAMEKHVQHSKPPQCLTLLEGTLVCHFRVNHGEVFLGHALPLLERMAKPSDIAIVNFAHWHGTGDGPEYMKLLKQFRRAAEDRAHALPRFIWKEMVVTHYDQHHGLYPGGNPPFTCKPLHAALQPDGTLAATDDYSQIVIDGGHHNKAAREAFAGSKIGMTAYWNATVELWDFHRDLSDGRGHECGHYCFPGAPQVWLYYAYLAMQSAP